MSDQEKTLIVAFQLSQDISLSTAELNRRNIPTQYRPTRSPARLAAMLTSYGEFKDGPLLGAKLQGSNKDGGYQLVGNALGNPVLLGEVEANGHFKLIWNPAARFAPDWMAASETWLQNHVARLADTLDRATVRRVFLAWLKDIGLQETGLPGLYEGPVDCLPKLDEALEALPEGEWIVWQGVEL